MSWFLGIILVLVEMYRGMCLVLNLTLSLVLSLVFEGAADRS